MSRNGAISGASSPHPGKVLMEEFLRPLAVSPSRLAEATGIPRREVEEVCLGTRSMSAEFALRISRFFGTDPKRWVFLQALYDLHRAETVCSDRVLREVRPAT